MHPNSLESHSTEHALTYITSRIVRASTMLLTGSDCAERNVGRLSKWIGRRENARRKKHAAMLCEQHVFKKITVKWSPLWSTCPPSQVAWKITPGMVSCCHKHKTTPCACGSGFDLLPGLGKRSHATQDSLR